MSEPVTNYSNRDAAHTHFVTNAWPYPQNPFCGAYITSSNWTRDARDVSCAQCRAAIRVGWERGDACHENVVGEDAP